MSYSGSSKQNGQFPTSSHFNKHRFFFQGHTRVLQNSISQIKTVVDHLDCAHEKKKKKNYSEVLYSSILDRNHTYRIYWEQQLIPLPS